ncbi:transmembrane gamma-carboxyglutamic acid protein 1 isoform X3 [Oncorhynchus tshawytscha]|uniref:transmembrane gamma-carboxyglutamic acid protein 1 isoform X3 n=1 Tax=Oncorhynchus tshawytscha TaxID=74940 RepID=UPI001C3D956B|nr:transmembrane gamma-carboxyglutamic acid protein 1 isoform X3 [Oncorhynchus tshawytscha]
MGIIVDIDALWGKWTKHPVEMMAYFLVWICGILHCHPSQTDQKESWGVQRFWEEYVRESSGGQQLEGRVHSLYLILPLLLVLLISGVAITVWRCHSRKRSERNPALGHSHRDPTLSLVSMDRWGRDLHDHSELSVNSSPADPGSEVTSARGGRGDPPPSYNEAVGHTDVHIETEPPPQYEDIIGHGK